MHDKCVIYYLTFALLNIVSYVVNSSILLHGLPQNAVESP